MSAATTTESFGERSLATTSETNTTAMGERSKARENARFIMALQKPRSWDDVRVRILKECGRTGFAKVARYRKPIGKGVEGPSIRFAEACFRYAGNLDAPTAVIFDDDRRRIISVQVIDLETNASYSDEVTIEKTVERKFADEDRTVVSKRTNSYGKPVYTVVATEDELLNKINSAISKTVRTLVLRLIPGDIVEEGQAACIRTLESDAAKDPAARRKEMCDSFATYGVFPADLERYLGHKLEATQPAEVVELQAIFETIKERETTWAAVMASRDASRAGGAAPPYDPKTGEVKDDRGSPDGETLDEKIARAAAEKKDKPKSVPPKPPIEVAKAANDSPQAPPITQTVPSSPCLICRKLGVHAEMIQTMVQGQRGLRHAECDPMSVPVEG